MRDATSDEVLFTIKNLTDARLAWIILGFFEPAIKKIE
jgi:hypothetical protein